MPALVRGLRARRGGDPLSIQIVGAERLGEVAKALRQAGDKDLRKELYRGLRSAAKPLIADARAHARQTLPKHGGLNERVARSRFKVSTRGTGRSPGVRITATGPDARVDKTGRVRHPVYGNRDVWVVQQVPSGWFSEAMERGSPEVRRELLAVIETVARKIEKA